MIGECDEMCLPDVLQIDCVKRGSKEGFSRPLQRDALPTLSDIPYIHNIRPKRPVNIIPRLIWPIKKDSGRYKKLWAPA